MWSGYKYTGRKWGMVIDLNTCTGCSACMIACQSENNIPTVGKKNVLNGREMHWLRLDRYYVGEPDSPDSVYQPIVCMHCDNAPCETVCPVAATVHGDEGTNDMIYNRCVGTRYCSNNCPYKVRRFNWFDYTEIPSPKYLALNPEVTVRHRGVMEKCTFCIHRIRFEEAQAKVHDRELKDGDVVTACQQSCPTGAIVFGNLNDPKSRVAQLFKEENAYALLEELNTQPAVRYKTKIRNVAKLEGRPVIEQPEGEKENSPMEHTQNDNKGSHS
jgi:molybdopterin-containing oxidoreductase family iron-sulfur binding subunit